MKLERIHKKVIACKRCERLIPYCQDIAQKKKRAHKNDTYWGGPVPGFGDPNARIWIIGLAPAAHGANRTGRMFTGDSSGFWLYRALYEHGFSNQSESTWHDDTLKLKNVYISSAARCAPPQNKPTREEIENCAPYLDKEFKVLKNTDIFLCLGGISFNTTLKLLKRQGYETKGLKFGHNELYDIEDKKILCSYHPSRQNTNTKRLTKPMFDKVFRRAQKLVGS